MHGGGGAAIPQPQVLPLLRPHCVASPCTFSTSLRILYDSCCVKLHEKGDVEDERRVGGRVEKR
jgi:hypothetical protein